MKAVIVDIDGTLADCRHRLHHVIGPQINWPDFFATMADDDVIRPVADVVSALAREYKVVLCSGRPEDYRDVTLKWLDDHAIPHDALYMRASGDFRADHIVKAQILGGIREDGYEPFIVIDDRPSVVEMWCEQGLICLQAAPGERPIPTTAKLTLMVGPSGAGKTSWLHTFGYTKGIEPAHIVSADQLRSDLCGDFRDQSQNHNVFEAMHDIVRTRAKHGLHTIIDATHVKRKHRVQSALLVPATCEVQYMVFNRPMADKIRDGGWRNNVKRNDEPFDLIADHERVFAANLKDILRGDGLPNVTVVDLRSPAPAMAAAA